MITTPQKRHASPPPANDNGDAPPTVEQMRFDLAVAGYGADFLARFMKHYPNIPEAKAVEMFHAVY
jgi:hypothetical protein